MGTKTSNTTKKTNVKKVAKIVKGNATAKTAKAKTVKTKAPKAPRESKYIGVSTGLRVQAFQDKLMKDNYRAKLTDAALAKAMRDEFPNAIAFTEKHVAGIRSQWNHGHRPSQEGVAPDRTLARFDEEGNAMPLRARTAKAEKPAKGKAAKPAKKAKPAPVEDEEEDEVEEDLEDDDADADEEDE